MSKSILQTKKECYLCRKKADLIGWKGDLPSSGLHKHHIVFGSADRKVSESAGVWCWLCAKEHHVYGPESVHGNHEVAAELMKDAQEKFEALYSHDAWMALYGRNYL